MKEWQGLLDSLTRAYMTLLKDNIVLNNNVMLEDRRNQDDALADVDIVLATRIFIADDVELLDVRKKWATNVTLVYSNRDKATFKARYQAIRMSIVDAAKQTK
jgi:hypothetical protein